MKPSLFLGSTEKFLARKFLAILRLCDLRSRKVLARLASIVLAIFSSLGILSLAAHAQTQAPSYRIVPLPSGLRANDVNDAGQVAGCYPGASPTILHAVIYSNGNITDLGVGDNSCANVINNKGDVAGINGAGHVFFWSAAATPQLQDLGLPPHIPTSYGIVLGGMNDAGQIAGSAYLGLYGSATEGFISQPGQMGQPGTWNELQPDPVNGVLSIGLNAINGPGDVAGQTVVYNRYIGAFTLGYLRTNSGTASVISPNPYWQHCGYNGAQVPTVIAAGINDSGEVVGSHGGNLCNVPVAFAYTTSGGLALHDGSSQTLEDDALGVTNDGRVLVTFLIYDNNLVYPTNRYSILYAAPGSCEKTHPAKRRSTIVLIFIPGAQRFRSPRGSCLLNSRKPLRVPGRAGSIAAR